MTPMEPAARLPAWPAAWGEPPGSALIRATPEDFQVTELPGFDLSGAGEHAYLLLQKRSLNTAELAERIARLSGVALREIGYSGLKDRNALTRQWFSVGLAGRQAPDWHALESPGDVRVLALGAHQRKLRRGTHAGNQFQLVLRELRGKPADLNGRLELLRQRGVPNYFGPQRFGRDGATLRQALRWAARPARVSRARRGLFYSALRAYLFNRLLALRVEEGYWNAVCAGDVCILAGSRSYFRAGGDDGELQARLDAGDIHPGLPLWGVAGRSDAAVPVELRAKLATDAALCAFLEEQGLELAWRPTRMLPDDFSWRFCDDDSLQLSFTLGAGSYATALLAELANCREGVTATTTTTTTTTAADGHGDRGIGKSDKRSEQG